MIIFRDVLVTAVAVILVGGADGLTVPSTTNLQQKGGKNMNGDFPQLHQNGSICRELSLEDHSFPNPLTRIIKDGGFLTFDISFDRLFSICWSKQIFFIYILLYSEVRFNRQMRGLTKLVSDMRSVG